VWSATLSRLPRLTDFVSFANVQTPGWLGTSSAKLFFCVRHRRRFFWLKAKLLDCFGKASVVIVSEFEQSLSPVADEA